jgi:phosphate-selective porin OprO and OprP
MKKRWIILLSVILIVSLLTIQKEVCAKTLEELLLEKGAITEEEYKQLIQKETTQAKPVDYKIGRGFTFTSEDENFQLSLGGRLQARYTFFDNDDRQDVSQFRIQRMKVWFAGHAYTKDLTYLLQVDAVNSDDDRFIDHAYLNYKFIPEAQLLAGQTKVPFGRQWITSSGSQSFVDRAEASNFFRPGYDIGLKFHGKFSEGLINYDLGGYNGRGQGITNNDNNHAVALRLTVNPLGDMSYSESDFDTTENPLVSLGGNYYYNRVQVGTGQNNLNYDNNLGNIGMLSQLTPGNGFLFGEKTDLHLYGFDVAFKWMGFFATAEYLLSQADGDDSDESVRSHGFFVQAGYFIIPNNLEVAARYGYIDPHRSASNDLQSEVGGAVSYYFNKHNLKLQADVRNLHQQRATGATDDMQYRLQAQIIF